LLRSNELRLLELTDVLLHAGQRHAEGLGGHGDRRAAGAEPVEDGATGRLGEGCEGAVVLCGIPNHWVHRTEPRATTQTRAGTEVLRTVMRGYHAELRAIVEHHGGRVEKFVGDAAMAVFGIPRVHEDDPLRAVRAAVEMREAVASLGVEVRVGVNTGEVVAGS